MLPRIKGIYRDGRIELKESPENVPEGTTAIVTFVSAGDVDSDSHRHSTEQAEPLSGSLSAFNQHWDSPELSIYD